MKAKWASASVIGTSHIRAGTRKQDAMACFRTHETFCAIACDGAGSAVFGGEGASLTTRHLALAMRNHFTHSLTPPSRDVLFGWIDEARDLIEVAASKRSVDRRMFATTLVMLAVNDLGLMVAHIGDGAVVACSQAGTWTTVSAPENGEYASSTFFVTDDPEPRLRYCFTQESFKAFSLFTDGIEDLALDQATSQPHQPFFKSMIKPLTESAALGKSAELSHALAQFLAGDRVCSKTDDDKTLLLMTL